jgi:hypothetical protein
MARSAEVSSTRYSLDNTTEREKLGPLRELAGTWEGRGFNLIARPDFRGKADLYLQLNQTHETLTVTPIGSAIPNRGFGQDDIELFGLSYLQKIHDHHTGGALHLEPGLWITQPFTTYPPQYPPPNGWIIARMASIPHGSTVLAQGSATRFTGAPTLSPRAGTELQAGIQIYNGSVFRSFNSTPFPATPPIINAPNSSQKLTAQRMSMPHFKQYDVPISEPSVNPRTPFATSPPGSSLPDQINGVPLQHVINDPIRLLQAVIEQQEHEDCTFEGFALNIATRSTVTFRLNQDSARTGPAVNILVKGGAGGIENILFLEGGEPQGAQGPNAQARLVYATFWIEKVMPKYGPHFMQLQYAQMAVLCFPIFTLLHPPKGDAPAELVKLGWPHISVATLRKAF